MATTYVDFDKFLYELEQNGFPPVAITLNPLAEASMLIDHDIELAVSPLTKEQAIKLVTDYPHDEPWVKCKTCDSEFPEHCVKRNNQRCPCCDGADFQPLKP